MPVHDWSRVDAGIFHDFHLSWVCQLCGILNQGTLPSDDYYTLTERHAGQRFENLLGLHALSPTEESSPPSFRQLRRTLAIRHVSGHRLIALLEIVSPANKDRPLHVAELARKIEEALRRGVHVLLVDLFAPGKHDPHGMHGAVWDMIDEEPLDVPPPGEPLTLASYVADTRPEAYLEHLAIGTALPDMPLFLNPERYVNVPLEATYQAAYRGTPAYWRGVVERGLER